MAGELRLVGATSDTYGSRRAWRRHRRVARRRQGAWAVASVAILAIVLLAALLSQSAIATVI